MARIDLRAGTGIAILRLPVTCAHSSLDHKLVAFS
jgi:hypothetical protein